LPVLGREEDAVDRFATFLLTPEGGEDAESDPSSILIDAMRGWFAASERTELAESSGGMSMGPISKEPIRSPAFSMEQIRRSSARWPTS
jgi:hypothetical protein